jgi:hypothetical protein
VQHGLDRLVETGQRQNPDAANVKPDAALISWPIGARRMGRLTAV